MLDTAKQDSEARKDRLMGKVWDVRRPARTFKQSNEELISELHRRGVDIEQIFGQYYAEEAMADAHSDEIFGNDEEGQHGDPNRFKPLTVGDAHLAGAVPPLQPKVPLGTIPF